MDINKNEQGTVTIELSGQEAEDFKEVLDRYIRRTGPLLTNDPANQYVRLAMHVFNGLSKVDVADKTRCCVCPTK